MQTKPINDYIATKSNDFIEEIKKNIAIRHQLATEDGRPQIELPTGRTSMGTQGHNASVLGKELIEGRNVILAGETGSGKTHVTIKAVMIADSKKKSPLPYRTVVICPPQIAKKWAEEEIPADDPTGRVHLVADIWELVSLLKLEKILDSFQIHKHNGMKEAVIATKLHQSVIEKILLTELGTLDYEQITQYAAKRKRLWIICDNEKLKRTYTWKHGFIESSRFLQPQRKSPKNPELIPHEYLNEDDKIMKVSRTTGQVWPVCQFCQTVIVQWDRRGAVTFFTAKEMRENNRRRVCAYCKEPLWQAEGSSAYENGRVIRSFYEWDKLLQAKKPGYIEGDKTSQDSWRHQIGSVAQNHKPMRDKGQKGYSLADALKRYHYNLIDVAIIDEVHQYKSDTSARGIAAGQVAGVAKKVIAMTGTLMGGYSTTLLYIMLRFTHGLYKEFPFGESETKWIDRYGYRKTVWTEDSQESWTIGKATKRKANNKRSSEFPGITPDLLKLMLSNTVFMHIRDVSDKLPEYRETVMPVEMSEVEDEIAGESQYTAYMKVKQAIIDFTAKTVAEGSKRGIGLIVTKLRPYASMVEKGITVYDPQPDPVTGKHKVIVDMPPVEPVNEPRQMWPKEIELLSQVTKNKAAGRKSLIYVENTDTLDIIPRLIEVLESENLVVGVLRANSPNIRDRAKWLEKRAHNWDALICSPKLVETGMDLNKYGFTNIIWYQMVYSSYTVGQASKRSYRIGQTEDCTTTFLAYSGTIEMNALKLVAQKIQVSEALEGKLSNGAFTTMVDDMNAALARALLDYTEVDKDEIQSIFNRQAEADKIIGIETIQEEEQEQPKESLNGVYDHKTLPELEQTLVLTENPTPPSNQEIIQKLKTDRNFVLPEISNPPRETHEQEGVKWEAETRVNMWEWSEKMKVSKKSRDRVATKEQPSLFDAFV